ncbi:ankyrin repeat domain-containing protein [Streptomyces sp. NPDC051211]|uniref:ankyrin repeat domain-containing protein n=1 Tax=Streptomyces sp. NPDC051211 TaxID=3154643 RepID=UPI00344EF0CC
MNQHTVPGGLSREDASSWQRIRRYAVPRWMIEQSGGRRLAGDWRGACTAANVDPLLDPGEVADRYGTAVAARLAEDLRHLAPDLLRWHAPRMLGGSTVLQACRILLLARYGEPDGPADPSDPSGPYLYAELPVMAHGPQRISLRCGPVRPDTWQRRLRSPLEDWTAARHLWHAGHTAELRERVAGGPGRLPFFTTAGRPLTPGELPTADPGPADPAGRAEWIAVLQDRGDEAEALEAAGFEPDPGGAPGRPWYSEPAWILGRLGAGLHRIGPEVRRLTEAGAGERFAIATPGSMYLLLQPAGTHPDAGVRIGYAHRNLPDGVVPLPGHAWQRPPDPALVRAGLITPRALHPLVAAALFPEAGPADGPPAPTAPAPVRVRCGDGWHEVGYRDGRPDMPHTEQEQQRERAMRAFGGAVTGCFAVQQALTGTEGRLPRALRAQLQDLLQHALHGDTPGVVALLDAGLDPRVRVAGGRTLLHLLHLVDHERLLPRLLAAGLDLEAHDKQLRTPLYAAVHGGGSPDLVRALLGAGARIDITDQSKMSLAQMITRYRRTDLAFLAERTEAECPGIGAVWWDRYNERIADR